jgi:predicted permease
MVVQLMIFGIYLATVDKNDIPWRLLTFVTFVKFAFIPLAALMILSFLDLENIVYNVVLLELLVPMAVMNVNLAALYDCRPERVAFLTFATSAIFLIYLFAMAKWVFV